MAFERKQYYPEHDRTSCSDADPCNAEAGGSHGCARCTAIMMDERDALAERCERLEVALREVMRPYGMYEKAVFHTTGHGQDCVLDAGRAIEALLSEKGAAP